MSIVVTRLSSVVFGSNSPLLNSLRRTHSPQAVSNLALRHVSSSNGGDTKALNDTGAHHVADGPYDLGYHEEDDRFIDGKPSLSYVKSMPSSFSSMRHEQILQLAAEGVPKARKEALVRNVMAVDSIEYEEAQEVVKEITKASRKNIALHHLPFKIGLYTAVFGGLVSVPMVFHSDTVHAFNEYFVTADVPEPKDLETWLEVGSWSWAWMEPLIGQASFFLLTMQFARSQLQNLGLMPYSDYMRKVRSERLIELYPQYNAEILAAYSDIKSKRYE
uniref:Uncharacterized protein n=1 Tax=Pseudictyota dubia TaxID=2749911 RepID=A0A7R9ZEU6_9STRA|mmetsp:Transcript_48313/g.89586  ORF Transcript_48313/g.89586 Transcript_48313/m.89586 type:complete len:275 (+) Transcript_48313:136-960(+)